MKYKKKCIVPSKLVNETRNLELFIDLSKKINEWDYWRKQIIRSFTKIVLGGDIYKNVEKDDAENLEKLLNNIELIFFKGLNSQKTIMSKYTKKQIEMFKRIDPDWKEI